MRRTGSPFGRFPLVITFLLACSAVSSLMAQPAPVPIEVSGRVVEQLPPTLEPVPCCTVRITLLGNPLFPPSVVETRTRADGTFSAELDCYESGGQQEILVEALCCGGRKFEVIDGCTDPVTGDPVSVNVGDVICVNSPARDITAFRGDVVCRDGVFLEPVVDCPILIRDQVTGQEIAFTRTDDDGHWEACVACNNPLPTEYEVIAQCCGESVFIPISDCPATEDVDTIVCQDCPTPPCPADPQEIELTGRVLCDDGFGQVVPLADCNVRVELSEGCTMGVPPQVYDVRTDQDGFYTLCVPCLAEEDCPNWNVLTIPECCPNARVFTPLAGCEPNVRLPDNYCQSPAGCPPMMGDCAPMQEQSIEGRVTCRDPLTGMTVGVPGCTVTVECATPGGDPPLTAVTDQNGNYQICAPCFNCPQDVWIVRAECCNAVRQIPGDRCAPVVRADLDCGDCEPESPCGINSVLARGNLICQEEPDDDADAIAGCDIILTPRDVTGAPLDDLVARTDGSGDYEVCVPCGPNGLALIDAQSACCDVMTSTQVNGCPEVANLDQLVCQDCNKCPEGMTRIQGRVKCRKGDAVADCLVDVTIPFCDGTAETYTTMTDEKGKYRLCVPCPCEDSRVRVTSSCCMATKTKKAKKCKKTLSLPTLHCKSGCD